MATRNPHLKVAQRLASGGLACFLVSLALPSVKMTILSSPSVFAGWQATWCSILVGCEAIFHFGKEPVLENAKLAVLGIAGVWNVSFIVVPAVLVRGKHRNAPRYWLGGVPLAGLLLGIAAPFTVHDLQPTVMVGYFVWLTGYGALLAAGIVAGIAHRGPTELT